MKVIRVIAGNNVDRKHYTIQNNKSIREFLENDVGMDYSNGSLRLDGASLGLGDMDKTFEELGIETSCFLLNVAKADNA